MKQERRKEIDELFEEHYITLGELIDYYGEQEVIDNLYLSDWELLEQMDDPTEALDYIDTETIRSYYRTHEDSKYPTLEKIKDAIREIKPKGYIDKEEAKRILSDYIDTWFDRAI